MAQRGASSKVTTDHEVIKSWVEARGGCPATVQRTARGRDPGIIRIDYPGYSGQQSLEPIAWDEFFEKFEDNGLAFLYQEQTARGEPSRFSKLVKRKPSAAGRGRRPTAATSARGDGGTEKRRSTRRARPAPSRSPSKPGAATSRRGSSTTQTTAASRPTPRPRRRAKPASSTSTPRTVGSKQIAKPIASHNAKQAAKQNAPASTAAPRGRSRTQQRAATPLRGTRGSRSTRPSRSGGPRGNASPQPRVNSGKRA